MGTPSGRNAPLPAEAKGFRPASQLSVDKLTAKVDSMMSMMTLMMKRMDSVSPSPSAPVTAEPVLDMARAVYESCARALADKEEYVDKESRAVVIGVKEKATPSETLATDQQLVADLVAYCGSEEVQKAWDDQTIKIHRHPPDRPPGARPLKIACPDKSIRDMLLTGIRSKRGRPAPFKDSLAFIRKDLTPSQLQLEREARAEATKRNLEAGMIVCGVRDFSLIQYHTHRKLPDHYGQSRANPSNRSAVDTRSGCAPPALSGASSASASAPTTPDPPLMLKDVHVNKAPRR